MADQELDELVEQAPPPEIDSKYRLIILAAKRSKQLQRGARPRIEIDSTKHETAVVSGNAAKLRARKAHFGSKVSEKSDTGGTRADHDRGLLFAEPVVLADGGRMYLSDHMALTVRLGLRPRTDREGH